jgi:hypothetical protein
MVIINTCFGIWSGVVDVGGSTVTGSGWRKLEVRIKNVTSKNARSTNGVISKDGAERGIDTFGISYFFLRFILLYIER